MPALKPESPASRREFCARICRGGAGLLAAGVLAGCDERLVTPSSDSDEFGFIVGSVSGRSVTVPVDGTTLLQAPGTAAVVQTAIGTFLVARTGPATFTALTSECTHQGCAVSGFEDNQFVCPCHGSRFTPQGTVAQGPATRPLTAFATQYAAGVVTFVA